MDDGLAIVGNGVLVNQVALGVKVGGCVGMTVFVGAGVNVMIDCGVKVGTDGRGVIVGGNVGVFVAVDVVVTLETGVSVGGTKSSREASTIVK